MKNAIKILALLLIILLNSCKKNKTESADMLTEDNLTECLKDTYCTYLYADNAGMDGYYLTLTTGQYRVFWANTGIGQEFFSLYFMAPMLGDRFELTKVDFTEGRVKYRNNCSTCYAVSAAPVDGKITGKKIPQVAGLPEKWLVEADVVLAVGSTNMKSIHLKQYYFRAN